MYAGIILRLSSSLNCGIIKFRSVIIWNKWWGKTFLMQNWNCTYAKWWFFFTFSQPSMVIWNDGCQWTQIDNIENGKKRKYSGKLYSNFGSFWQCTFVVPTTSTYHRHHHHLSNVWIRPCLYALANWFRAFIHILKKIYQTHSLILFPHNEALCIFIPTHTHIKWSKWKRVARHFDGDIF